MTTVRVNFEKTVGKIKPMHAVNNGPTKGPRMFPLSGNFDAYKEAGIPFARNHDAAFCASYGGEHTVDINAIFPNFRMILPPMISPAPMNTPERSWRQAPRSFIALATRSITVSRNMILSRRRIITSGR